MRVGAPFASLNAKSVPRVASGSASRRSPVAVAVQRRRFGEQVLVAMPDDGPHRSLVPIGVLPEIAHIFVAPLLDGRAGAKAAQHCYSDAECKVAPVASCGPEWVMLSLVWRPFHQPVVALLRRVCGLAAKMDGQLHERVGLVAYPVGVRVGH